MRRLLGFISSALLAVIVASPASAAVLYGLTDDNQLIHYEAGTFQHQPALQRIKTRYLFGYMGIGEKMIEIDSRPVTGELMGLSTAGRLYTINADTGVITPIGNSFAIQLNGLNFGFDVAPIDSARIVSESGQNFRVNPTTGEAFSSTNLAFKSGDPNFGMKVTMAACSYTDVSQKLYGLERNTQSLVLISPANSGQVTTIKKFVFQIDPEISQPWQLLENCDLDCIPGTNKLLVLEAGTNLMIIDNLGSEPTAMLFSGVGGGDAVRESIVRIINIAIKR